MYLVTSTSNAALLIFTSQLLPNKLNPWKTVALALIISVFAPIKMQFEIGTPIFLFIGLLVWPVFLCLPIFFYSGKLWKRYAIFLFFIILMTCCEAIGAALITVVYGDIKAFYTETTPMLLYAGTTLATYVLFGSVAVFAWKMIVARKFQPFFCLFFLLPIGQLITIYSFMFSSLTSIWILGVLISLIASLVLLVYTIQQEKKTALEEELRETRHAMELEQTHYQEVEQRREELAKIRHDFNNQLATIGQLIQAGEKGFAQDMIYTLSEEISATREYSYCSIPVINAILTEKARTCAAEGIGLDVELDMSPHLAVEQLHLCSIFANLLDNAINSCKQMKDSVTPTIELKSMVDGRYLFIKAVNPSYEPPKKPLPGRGYGFQILSDYAARYSGDYRTKYEDGRFTAMVSLLAVDEA